MAEFTYVPILRWKQGEQGALRNTDAADRAGMLPIIEVQTLETGTTQPKLQAQLLRSAGTVHPIGIDLSVAYPGAVRLDQLSNLCVRFQGVGILAWPVVRVPHALLDMTNLARFKGQSAVIVRTYADSSPITDVLSVVQGLRKACGRGTQIHVVLDLYALGDVDAQAKANLLLPQVRALTATGVVTTVAMAGGSFPMNLGGLKQGVANRLLRQELEIWKLLRGEPGCEEVVFGDYGVTNPEPLEDIDPTKMNPAAAIRYTLTNEWWVLRGSGVRTQGRGGMGQYNDLCRILIKSPDYSGQTFSYGDGQYHSHAQPNAKSGNLTTWRRDATSHHIVFTVRQLIAGNV